MSTRSCWCGGDAGVIAAAVNAGNDVAVAVAAAVTVTVAVFVAAATATGAGARALLLKCC